MFADRLKELRNKKGLTQTELAKSLKVANGTIGNWESCKRQPDFKTVCEIADFFEVAVGYLLERPDPNCPLCGFNFFSPDDINSTEHQITHEKAEKAIDKFGFFWTYNKREDIKGKSRQIVSNPSYSLEERIEAQHNVFKALFSRSVAAYGADGHPDLSDYISMLLYQNHFKKDMSEDLYTYFSSKYEPKPGIDEGLSTYSDIPVNSQSDIYSRTEKNVISKYRRLDNFGKELVDVVIDKELVRVEKTAVQKIVLKRFPVQYYDKPASAGTGNPLDYETSNIVYISEKPPKNTSFMLKVSGNSMEPTYKEDDYVFVNIKEQLKYGDIGIFIYENKAFIKEYGKDGLISHNPNYSTVVGTEQIKCVGKVIGKYTGNIEEN